MTTKQTTTMKEMNFFHFPLELTFLGIFNKIFKFKIFFFTKLYKFVKISKNNISPHNHPKSAIISIFRLLCNTNNLKL